MSDGLISVVCMFHVKIKGIPVIATDACPIYAMLNYHRARLRQVTMLFRLLRIPNRKKQPNTRTRIRSIDFN